MRKIILSLFLIANLACFAQSKSASDVTSIKFYGIDYSMAKVYGAAETPGEFKVAFDGINLLFITEAKKYNLEKFLGISVTEISLDAVNEVNNKIKPDDLRTTNQSYTRDDQQIAHAVQALPIEKEPGVGMVIIAKLLNKAANNGSYQIVFFNTDTKEIIESTPANGKAKGFGLRNFWAGSIYQVLKRL